MSDRLKEQAIEAGYGDGIGSQLLAKIDELEAELADRARRHAADVEERDRKIGQLREDIKRLEAENARLRACLKRLEWAGKEMTGYGGVVLNHCPACESPKGAFNHEEDCWLAAEIGGLQ